MPVHTKRFAAKTRQAFLKQGREALQWELVYRDEAIKLIYENCERVGGYTIEAQVIGFAVLWIGERARDALHDLGGLMSEW